MYVHRDQFDLILGFGGNSTLPLDVLPAITRLIHLVVVDQVTDPWEVVVRAMGSDIELLDITSIVVLFMGKFYFPVRSLSNHHSLQRIPILCVTR